MGQVFLLNEIAWRHAHAKRRRPVHDGDGVKSLHLAAMRCRSTSGVRRMKNSRRLEGTQETGREEGSGKTDTVVGGGKSIAIARRTYPLTLNPDFRLGLNTSPTESRLQSLTRKRLNRVRPSNLAAYPEPSYKGTVALNVGIAQVGQHAFAASNHHIQTAPGVMVLLVLSQVFRQLVDPRRQQRNLNL